MLKFAYLKNQMALQVLPGKEELVQMRIRGNRYYGYSRIKDLETGKSRQIEFALGVGLGERDHKRKAQISLGKKLEQIERGESPNLLNSKFSKVAKVWKQNPVCLKGRPHGTDDNFLILESLIKYFGGFKINEITAEVVNIYHLFRETKGIKQSTLEKHYRVLRWVMQSGSSLWKLPYLKFVNPAKVKEDEPLSYDQVFLMIEALPGTSRKYGKEYQDIAQVMAFTGLDTSDVLRLSRSSFKDGIITGSRGKTGKRFRLGVSKEVQFVFSRRKKEKKIEPHSLTASFFDVKSANSVSQAIGIAFSDVGLGQFHAKSLRDFYASILYNAGYPDNFIQDALGQVRGSSETKKYTKATADRLKKAASVFDKLSEYRRVSK